MPLQDLDLKVVWEPERGDVERTNLYSLLQEKGLDYDRFLTWSWEDPEGFWSDFLKRVDYPFVTPPKAIMDARRGIAYTDWFVGAETNLTIACVDRWALKTPDSLALIEENERGEIRTLTYRELQREVEGLSSTLIQLGVKKGDRVGILLPFTVEVAVSLLAVARIGAVAVPLFSGFGPQAILTRLNDSSATLLISTSGFFRRGKWVDLLSTIRPLRRELPHLKTVLYYGGKKVPLEKGELWGDRFDGKGEPVIVSQDTPFMLIYTSGTTGKPKGTVHVHCGFPIKSAQDMWHLFDVKREDRVFWLTDIGWMMGPWLILGTLTLGATVVMYDGAPDYPTVNRLWEVWDRHKVTIGGISPTFIRSVMPYGTEYFKGDHLSSLRVIGSTGEPWNPLPWLWTFDHVGRKKVPIINYSGGTEISGGILGCTFFRPLKPTSFNTVVPGVRAEVWNDDGKRVLKEVGYLVVLNPNPGMTRGFYNDLARYEETYFSRFPGVWFHGDLCYEDQDGFFYILGRADDTIKVAGKRLGPAEMESVAVEHPKVKESAVIGVPDPKKGEVPVLFVVLKGEIQEEENLKEEIRRWVEERMGKALSPAKIHIVPDLPKTRNAKVMRRVIRRVYLKEDPGDLSSLVNPEILGYFRNLS